MLRLFTGIALPQEHAKRIHLLQGGVPGAHWTAPENYHITLTFIGDVDEATAEDVDGALAALREPAFSLRLNGLGSFAQGSDPKVLWVGMDKSEPLSHLKEKIDRQLEIQGVPFENRKYTPHVTLARFKNPDELKLTHFMQSHGDFSLLPFDVNEFILYRSHLTKNGPVYEPLAYYPLEQQV